MKAVGIVAEYNPLHNGHLYHTEEAKRLSGADFVIVAMSGNFVQRGEPAIIDKWQRAEAAIKAGADIVFEIPTCFCLADASVYAKAGVDIIKASGVVSDLAFGSECADASKLATQAHNLTQNKSALDNRIKEIVKEEGCSYPFARAKAYREICSDEIIDGANDILALEYINNLDWLNPFVIPRKGHAYNSKEISGYGFASATAIREALRDGKDISECIPMCCKDMLNDFDIKAADNKLLELVKYSILNADAKQIDNCPSGGEGLGNRLIGCVNSSNTLDELILNAKSKRYTYTRISRLIMQLLIGIDRDTYQDASISYLRVLGLSKLGRNLIKEIEKHELNSLPIITNINKSENSNDNKLLELDVHAGDIYNLIFGRDMYKYSDRVVQPYIEKA